MEKLLVSACLLGVDCRYDGGNCKNEAVIALKDRYHLIPVCPECFGGLTTPRDPSELVDGRILSCKGIDVTAQFERGARQALYLAQMFGCSRAVLKARSPSCGRDVIYDGSFSGKLAPGNGATVTLLRENGIRVYTEDELSSL